MYVHVYVREGDAFFMHSQVAQTSGRVVSCCGMLVRDSCQPLLPQEGNVPKHKLGDRGVHSESISGKR